MKYLILIIALGLIGCEKDNACTTCEYTMTSIKQGTEDQMYYSAGKYKEVDFYDACHISLEDFKTERSAELQNTVDYEHGLNPHTDINLLTFESETWVEDWIFTISCEDLWFWFEDQNTVKEPV